MRVGVPPKGRGAGGSSPLSRNSYLLIIVAAGILIGYGLGYVGLNAVYDKTSQLHVKLEHSLDHALHGARSALIVKHRWAGDTIHSVVTSSGDAYQNYQTRIMYASYQLVQKMPGGEKMTGFTRILHRSVPDLLMRIIPTYHAWDVLKPACDGWCDYPVANRPTAIQQWIAAASANESMVMGAWVLMLECDYVWMKPMQVPGDAYDPSVPGEQFHYDYIIPGHADAVPWMQKLFPGGNISLIPPAGPAPVIMRFADWQLIGPDYVSRSAAMEADAGMTKQLGWVREMYAWDVAIAMHVDKVTVITSQPPKGRLIVQVPFDVGMGAAAMVHYTWGPIYYEGGSTKGKCIYKWEKREFSDIKYVIQVPPIDMPPKYRDGLTLTFEAPLTKPRHDLIVLFMTQVNKAIATLPNIQGELDHFNEHVFPAFQVWKEKILKERADKAAVKPS